MKSKINAPEQPGKESVVWLPEGIKPSQPADSPGVFCGVVFLAAITAITTEVLLQIADYQRSVRR